MNNTTQTMPKAQESQMISYKLKRKPSTEEWLVAAYVNGKFNDAKTYYTDDKQDAIDTLEAMQNAARSLRTAWGAR